MRLGWGHDDGAFFFSRPDAAQQECCEPGFTLLCMGLFSRFFDYQRIGPRVATVPPPARRLSVVGSAPVAGYSQSIIIRPRVPALTGSADVKLNTRPSLRAPLHTHLMRPPSGGLFVCAGAVHLRDATGRWSASYERRSTRFCQFC